MGLVDTNGRALSENGNGVTPITQKQHDRKMRENATLGEVHNLANAYVHNGLQHMAAQLPNLIGQMIGQAVAEFAALNGLTVPPAWVTQPAQSPVAEPIVSNGAEKDGETPADPLATEVSPPTDEVPPVSVIQ